MSTYHAPLTDIRFALHDVLQVEPMFASLGFEDAGRETLDAVLDECARLCETVLAPLKRIGDEVGVRFDKATGAIATPSG